MTKLDEILQEKFYVEYSEYDGHYHNMRQENGYVPLEEAKQQIKELFLELIGADHIKSRQPHQLSDLVSLVDENTCRNKRNEELRKKVEEL